MHDKRLKFLQYQNGLSITAIVHIQKTMAINFDHAIEAAFKRCS